MTNLHFCEACNKIRLTADGKIRPCLGNHGEFDLKPALREIKTDEAMREIFLQALREKPPEHLFRNNYQPGRIMTAIGG
jgi:cyclic pyranopterin phosphate synthase